jgi:hypothetical protein
LLTAIAISSSIVRSLVLAGWMCAAVIPLSPWLTIV